MHAKELLQSDQITGWVCVEQKSKTQSVIESDGFSWSAGKLGDGCDSSPLQEKASGGFVKVQNQLCRSPVT